jgi:hypothetical protein
LGEFSNGVTAPNFADDTGSIIIDSFATNVKEFDFT